MTSLIELLVLMGCLLAIVAWIQVLASRTGMPEATLLSLVGIAPVSYTHLTLPTILLV